MELNLEEGKHPYDGCSTLILPALSIGNVGQLAVDLLIASTKAERIGYLDDPNVLPCVGNDAYTPTPQGNLALPLEAYDSPSNALTLIQQRSPVVKGMMVEFAKNLADFSVACGKKHIVILSSLDFGRWQTIDMSSGLQIYYLSNAKVDGADDDCEKLGFKRMKEYNPTQKLWKYLNDLAEGNATQDDISSLEDDLGEEDYYPSLPFAAMFSCFKAKGLKVTCLLCYCSEGDNIPDSFHLAEAACNLVGLSPDTFRDEIEFLPPFPWNGEVHQTWNLKESYETEFRLFDNQTMPWNGLSNSNFVGISKPNTPLFDALISCSGNEGGRWVIPYSWQSVYGPPPDMSLF